MASVFKQGRFLTCIFLFWLMTILFCTQKEVEASDSILKYDCRKHGESCVIPGNCTLTGSCSCPTNTNATYYDYSCKNYSINPSRSCSADNDCNGHGLCNTTTTCICNEGYYGEKCSMGRVQVACNLTHMFINVNPYFSGGMFVYVSGYPKSGCDLQDNVNPDLKDFGFAEKVEGYNLVIPHKGVLCGDANETTNANQQVPTSYRREFQILDIRGVKTLEDKLIQAQCEIPGKEEVVKFGNYTVNDITNEIGVNVSFAITANVTLAVQNNGNDVSKTPIDLGADLDLIFKMNGVNNVYKDFQIKECTAEDVDEPLILAKFIDSGCPNDTLRSLFKDTPTSQILKSNYNKNSNPLNPVITLKLKAFMFTKHGSSAQIFYTCTVIFCNDECTQNCTNSAQPASIAGRRRRSADNEAKVSAVVTVVDPYANVKELKNSNQVEQCLQEPSFIATLATCGAVILILLIICIILATKLMTLRQKRVSEPASGYTGPAFELRIPRLSVSNSKEHFYPHD